MRLEFTVPGCPIPKARARVVCGHAFTPKSTTAYARKVVACYLSAKRGRAPIVGPVQVALWFYLPDRRRRDWDNLAKAITDALNGHAYADDSQISRARVDVAVDRGNPRCLVVVEPAEPAAGLALG